MFAEIYFGMISGPMALLADGWHMGTHVGALLISFFSYYFASSDKWSNKFSFGAGKLIPLGGVLDGESKYFKKEDIEAIFAYNSSIKIADLHIWQIAPNAHACEIIVYNNSKQGADFCRDKI